MSASLAVTRLETLGQVVENGYAARLDCTACGRSADLDLDSLVRQLGQAFPLAQIRQFSTCPHCSGQVKLAMRLEAFGPKPAGHPMAMRLTPRRK